MRQPLQRQVVALLAAVTPGSSEAEIAALPLGLRDAKLLDLRETLFGPDLATIVACPACGAQLEASFAVDDVRVPPDTGTTLAIETAGHHVAFRPPATNDLLAIPASADAEIARATLLARCVTTDMPPDALPPELLPAIAEGMARADPQAVVELELHCAGCAHGFLAIFDIAGFLMREIHNWARQMLRDIDSLARAYGWREADILALSPTRRQIYLEMVAR
ncbi:MAG: hypothetical protein ABW023_14630 [Sphingomonas sp.]